MDKFKQNLHPEQLKEQKRRGQLMARYIEKHILDKNKSLSEIEEAKIKDRYKEKSAAEKAAELYQKLTVYIHSKQKHGESINPKLISRIKILYDDPDVQKLFSETYGEVSLERKTFRSATLSKNWRELEMGKKTGQATIRLS